MKAIVTSSTSGRTVPVGLLAATLVGLFAAVSACSDSTTGPTQGAAAANVLYVLSNNPAAGQNAVLGYTRASDGTLTAMPGSPFLTGGTGVANATQMLGPDDVDGPIRVSPDHRRLFAVNPRSNTIAVMNIATNGALTSVAGSPFASGGVDPVSVALAGDKLYVVNQADDPAQSTTQLPNYTALSVSAGGQLTPITGSTFTTVAGAVPSQALLSPSHSILFGADFMAPVTPSHQGSLRSFAVGAGGTLTPAPGTPVDIPGAADPMTHLVLGLAVHPTQNVLYAGYVTQNKLGVYKYDGTTGALTFQTAVANSGKAICWIVVNSSGSALYTTNTADNSISWYTATNAVAPAEAQHLVLKESGPLYTNPMGMMFPTSQAFQLALDPAGKYLWVLSQHANPDFGATNGNILHTVTIAADGSVSEPATPVHLPVDTHTRPWGVVAF
ncbi:MAG: lactonase family protein [Gemmatimonadaceae bacterium]